MSIPGLSKEKCEQRNRITAKRTEIEGCPVHLYDDGALIEFASDSPNLRIYEKYGWLPSTEDEAIDAINAKRPADQQLTKEDVYIHIGEAASGNFIPDRFMFMDESTLRNIADDSAAGVSFMNSHRTGGMSHDAELPYGWTFAGQFQRGALTLKDDDEKHQKLARKMGSNKIEMRRTLFAFYMMRGVKPNGETGPSTDDFHRMIKGGTIADVSVGLGQGQPRCDVCNNDISDPMFSECSHSPGTHHNMSNDEIEAQNKKGAPGGVASYTYYNGRQHEVSAVYDGAVPGAGLRKTLSLAKALSAADMKLAKQNYGELFVGANNFGLPEAALTDIKSLIREAVKDAVSELSVDKQDVTEVAINKDNNGVNDMANKAKVNTAVVPTEAPVVKTVVEETSGTPEELETDTNDVEVIPVQVLGEPAVPEFNIKPGTTSGAREAILAASVTPDLTKYYTPEAPVVAPVTAAPATGTETLSVEVELMRRELEQLKAANRRMLEEKMAAEAISFTAEVIRTGLAYSAEADGIKNLYLQALMDDASLQDGNGRVALIKEVFSKRVPHGMTEDKLKSANLKVMPSATPTPNESDTITPERRKELLSKSETGRAVLQAVK